jgi:hypothetical protein
MVTNFAFNAGAGVIHALNDRVGLRADLRYFLAFVDETNRNRAYANATTRSSLQGCQPLELLDPVEHHNQAARRAVGLR